MKNHILMRKYIVCKNSKPKKELIRIVDRSSEIEIDYTGRANGRGAYICNNPECFDIAEKKGILKRAFRRNIDEEVLKTFFKELRAYEGKDS